MPQWCDKHKMHTIDETCPGCEKASQPQPNLSAAVQTLEKWKAKLDAYEAGSNALSSDEAGQLSACADELSEALSHLPRQREGE